MSRSRNIPFEKNRARRAGLSHPARPAYGARPIDHRPKRQGFGEAAAGSVAAGEDQREAAVRLTPAGERALMVAAPLWAEAQRRVEAALGDTGLAQMHTLAHNL